MREHPPMSRARFKTSTWMEQQERCEDRNHRWSTAPVHQDRRGEPKAAQTAPGDFGAYRAALRLRYVRNLLRRARITSPRCESRGWFRFTRGSNGGDAQGYRRYLAGRRRRLPSDLRRHEFHLGRSLGGIEAVDPGSARGSRSTKFQSQDARGNQPGGGGSSFRSLALPKRDGGQQL